MLKSTRALSLVFSLLSVFALSLWVFAGSAGPTESAGSADSCECPKLACIEECEVQKNLTFYSEKCANGDRVKSCSRPTCVKLDNAPASCGLAKSETVTPPSSASEDTSSKVSRDVASEQGPSIGRIKFIEGAVKRVMSSSNKVNLNVGDEVYEQNRIETDSTGKAQIVFNNGNILNLTPSSDVVITEVNDSGLQGTKKRMVLDLLKGKIRNQVKEKYDGEQSYYRVRVGAAVAGVRGTDFVVSFVDDQKEISGKVETFEGLVELSDSSYKEKVSLAPGETASYAADRSAVLNMMANGGTNADAKIQGHFTTVSKLTTLQLEALEAETNYALLKERENSQTVSANKIFKAKKSKDICASPQGAFHQCAWSCENNPAGEKVCRTDLPQVSCVRRICNANGEWSQPTRLPATYHEACKGDHNVVKACDY